MTIGERIKFKREELNISQDELARRLGYKSRSSINKIELGLQNLNQSKIKAIADALQTTPSFIMGWTEDGMSLTRVISRSHRTWMANRKRLPRTCSCSKAENLAMKLRV